MSLAAAASIVFIDGHDYPNGSHAWRAILGGQYQCTTTSCAPLTTPAPSDQLIFINNTAEYPGTLGLIDGLGAPTGDQSVADGQTGIAARLPDPSSSDTVTVVAFSEGAVAASHEISALGPSDNVNFVLAGNPERPNGGILARFPAGTYIPILGITGGNATPATGAPVVMVTQQYDGIADAPAYPLNLLADVNAFLGAYYLHGAARTTVGPTATWIPTPTETSSPPRPQHDRHPGTGGTRRTATVHTARSSRGSAADSGRAGSSVRAIIETGYDRTTDPSQQVHVRPPAAAIGLGRRRPERRRRIRPDRPGTARRRGGQFSQPARPSGVTTDHDVADAAPVSVTTTPLVRQTQLVSQLLPAPQAQPTAQMEPATLLQQDVVTNQPDTVKTDGDQQRTPAPIALSTKAAPSKPSRQTGFTPTNTTTTVNEAPGNEVTAPSPTAGQDPQSTNSNAPHRAPITGRHATTSVTGTSKHSASTSSSSPQATSGSPGSGPSHDKY